MGTQAQHATHKTRYTLQHRVFPDIKYRAIAAGAAAIVLEQHIMHAASIAWDA